MITGASLSIRCPVAVHATILMQARASMVENHNVIDACIAGMLADLTEKKLAESQLDLCLGGVDLPNLVSLQLYPYIGMADFLDLVRLQPWRVRIPVK
ncbi:hypothetical protein Tco_0019533 [Tanacetum coccineum]